MVPNFYYIYPFFLSQTDNFVIITPFFLSQTNSSFDFLFGYKKLSVRTNKKRLLYIKRCDLVVRF